MPRTATVERVSEADRRAVLRELTEPARQAFLSRFGSDDERKAYFREMAQEREAARSAQRDREHGPAQAAEGGAA